MNWLRSQSECYWHSAFRKANTVIRKVHKIHGSYEPGSLRWEEKRTFLGVSVVVRRLEHLDARVPYTFSGLCNTRGVYVSYSRLQNLSEDDTQAMLTSLAMTLIHEWVHWQQLQQDPQAIRHAPQNLFENYPEVSEGVEFDSTIPKHVINYHFSPLELEAYYFSLAFLFFQKVDAKSLELFPKKLRSKLTISFKQLQSHHQLPFCELS